MWIGGCLVIGLFWFVCVFFVSLACLSFEVDFWLVLVVF